MRSDSFWGTETANRARTHVALSKSNENSLLVKALNGPNRISHRKKLANCNNPARLRARPALGISSAASLPTDFHAPSQVTWPSPLSSLLMNVLPKEFPLGSRNSFVDVHGGRYRDADLRRRIRRDPPCRSILTQALNPARRIENRPSKTQKAPVKKDGSGAWFKFSGTWVTDRSGERRA